MQRPHQVENELPRHLDPLPYDDHVVERGCYGIKLERDEIVRGDAPSRGRGLISGFQHRFDFGESRTDTATTVHTLDDLMAEAN